MQYANRVGRHATVSTELALKSNKQLQAILSNAKARSSIGGETTSIEITETQVFVKKIPLTDLERAPDNWMSTANLFQLPLYFQYGISSAGFSAWREVAAHVMTTNWVLANECLNFPLMYHWRVLPCTSQRPRSVEKTIEIETQVKYWGGAPSIRRRLLEKQDATFEIVIFLEHIPTMLSRWFRAQMNSDAAKGVLKFVERDIKAVTEFMNAQGLLHFDAHFGNILTCGEHLYFTDFGLAISNRFDLSKEEHEFFKFHKDYDRALSLANLVHWAQLEPKQGTNALVSRFSPISLLMKKFNSMLTTQSKRAPFPAEEIANALEKSGF